MDFQKPSEPVIVDTLAVTGGGFVGGMLSRAVVGLIHNPTATDEAGIKKEEKMLLVKRGGLAVAGIAGAAFITGKDPLTSFAKGACLGTALVQGLEVVKELAKSNGVTADPSASKTKQALANAVGLGCGCGTHALNGSRRRRHALRGPVPQHSYSNMDTYAPQASIMDNAGGGLDAWAGTKLLN